MKLLSITSLAVALAHLNSYALPQEASLEIDAGQKVHGVSRFLTGACLEDVNHEVYGGIYSQMIFGESFQEPAPSAPLVGFTNYGGNWQLRDGALWTAPGDGPKLICDAESLEISEAAVDLRFAENAGGNAGLIVKVTQPGNGADAFTGYEVSLSPSGKLVLGRHRQNFESIRDIPCSVPLNQWVNLKVSLIGNSMKIFVDGVNVLEYTDTQNPLPKGQIGLRNWQVNAGFRDLCITTSGMTRNIVFREREDLLGAGVSGMWNAQGTGSAMGGFACETNSPFVGAQSQRITFTEGSGTVGIQNKSLNRWGMYFVGGQPYEGCLYARSAQPVTLSVSMESGDGATVLASQDLQVTSNNWQRLDFSLTPNATNIGGQFSIKLKQPGSVVIGYAFLQPGEWGRYKGLPIRKDVVQGLIDQKLTIMRYGGTMVNVDGYRWKNMVGPRAQRSPYRGHWYRYATDGWGIFDFVNLCEAIGVTGIPAINMGESARDMADFVEYANGSTNTVWGARRAADGHPQPYGLKYIEMGNEERVDESYFQKFKPLAEAIWAKDPNIILVVGDFGYRELITDPFKFQGADSGITGLEAQQKILKLAKQNSREVWFDVHIWTEGPLPSSYLPGTLSFNDALSKIADGAAFKVVVFELNANNHQQRRALANAMAINTILRDGRIPVVVSANCLQPAGQNDNGWDQGLLFLNPSQVWIQPPGYVERMISSQFEPWQVQSTVQNAGNLDVTATRSDDGHNLVLQVVNPGNTPSPATIKLKHFAPTNATATVEVLAGNLNASNTANNPSNIVPSTTQWQHGCTNNTVQYTFAPNSFSILRFKGNTEQ